VTLGWRARGETRRALARSGVGDTQRAVQSGWRGRLSRLTEPGEPLLAASARPWLGALVAGCATLVVALGVLFAGERTADQFDHAVDQPIVALFAGHERLALWLVRPGSLYPAVVISAVIVAACLVAGRLNGALLSAAAVPVAEVFSEKLFKPLVDRTLLGGISYPSGHTTAIVALAAMLTVLLLGPLKQPRARTARAATLAVAYAIVAGVALGLIGLRWHYFTDTVGGAAVAIGTVGGLVLILDSRFVRRQLKRGHEQLTSRADLGC
jgi:membrane-associated phospholipid phosphatase